MCDKQRMLRAIPTGPAGNIFSGGARVLSAAILGKEKLDQPKQKHLLISVLLFVFIKYKFYS